MEFSAFLLETKYTKIVNALRGDVPHVNQMGIMTAQNPLGKAVTPQENNARNRAFVQRLRTMMFRAFPVNPQWLMGKFGNIEDSYFIPHIDRWSLIELAAEFGQKSFIWGKKHKEANGETFVRFEYIETSQSEEPLVPSSYSTVQTRDVVVTGEEAQKRQDNYSARPYPLSGVDKKTGQPVSVRKFAVPFFEPGYEGAKYIHGKRQIDKTEEVIPDISFISSDLPDTEEVKKLVEEIRRKEADLNAEDRVPKWYMMARGTLEHSVQKLRDVLRG